jgi:hypothetical protein
MKIKQGIININKIIESPLNARKMDETTFNRLVKNIKKDKTLTSAALCMEQSNTDKLMCISGHHRIRAAKKAGLKEIPVIIIPEISESKRIALQISHNDIDGIDDPNIISIMASMINDDDIDMIDISGLEDVNINPDSIYYERVQYKYINICFLPNTAEAFANMIFDLGGDDENTVNYIIPNEDRELVKSLLTRAFKQGFKTPGQAFKKFLEIVKDNL